MKSLGTAPLLDKEFIGTDQLRKTLTDVLTKIGQTKELIITQHGRPQAVLVDLKTYLQLTQSEAHTIGKSVHQEEVPAESSPDSRAGTIFSFSKEEAKGV